MNNSSFSFGSTSFSISSSELSASNSLVNTYIYILKSRTTLEDVISKAGLPYTYEELSKMITTNAVSGTAAFDVTVRSLSPTEAEHIANTIAQVLPERIAEIVDGFASTMRLRNIPAELNGWRVYCRFSNNVGATNTLSALITVRGQAPIEPPILPPSNEAVIITDFPQP